MEIKYKTRDGKVMAIAKIKNRVFVAIAMTADLALADVMKQIEQPKFALYDMDAPTSMHNSSVRTRV